FSARTPRLHSRPVIRDASTASERVTICRFPRSDCDAGPEIEVVHAWALSPNRMHLAEDGRSCLIHNVDVSSLDLCVGRPPGIVLRFKNHHRRPRLSGTRACALVLDLLIIYMQPYPLANLP